MVQDKLTSIAERASVNKSVKFTSLAHLVNEELLTLCYGELKTNKATGIDGVTVKEYGLNLSENIKSLVERMKNKTYRCQPVRRVYIPKANGVEKRGLGIPSTEDKLVQLAIKKILEAIYDVDFIDSSHGFRPNRSCHTALKQVDEIVMQNPVNCVVEVDIRKFFDNVSHYWLQRCLEERINDPNFMWLIRQILKSGVMEKGEIEASIKGTPQGGIISPLLANIYLHFVLDIWFERKFKASSNQYMSMVRYCDDFVAFFESKTEADRFLVELKERLEKFSLSIAEDKTRNIDFSRGIWNKNRCNNTKSETFNFLGFTLYCKASRKGFLHLCMKTSRDNLRRKLKDTTEWIRKARNQHKLKDLMKTYKSKLTGHINYYGVSGNYGCVQEYYHTSLGIMFKWLNRRSQKKSFSFERFLKLINEFNIPKPKIVHRFYGGA